MRAWTKEELEEHIAEALEDGVAPADIAALTGASMARVREIERTITPAAIEPPRPLPAAPAHDPRARRCRRCSAWILDAPRGPVNEGTRSPHLETCSGVTPAERRELRRKVRGRVREDAERERAMAEMRQAGIFICTRSRSSS